MFNHLYIGSNNMDASRKFYGAIFSALGRETAIDLPNGGIAYPGEGGTFIVAPPADGEAAPAYNGFTLGLQAADYATVEAFYKAGLENGGKDAGEPGFRENSPGNMYGAYLYDPCGQKLCAYAPNVGPRD
ncbi:VOC family protein [Altericroceibacterium endophyticum]|uniref:VOC family protein n=1 Tax=Altericroceibacterium endophyticum TaxID=1808508 RepID=A0A6I4T4B3_9SPHN|nr:VOC family protein [Altericroceibacterium endophyticum]MXO65189.1 VOC family protein [Altericroceibacterium endophyticum]